MRQSPGSSPGTSAELFETSFEARRGSWQDHAPIILILGPPGSGKGTQAGHLSDRLHIPHISTGDMLRERILRRDHLGNQIAALIDVGRFVPDEWINRLLDERLASADCQAGYVLDGYPRTLEQAMRLVAGAKQHPRHVYLVRLLADAGHLARRFAGRRQCERCGALFHLEFQPSLRGDLCDRPDCEGKLQARADDKEEFLQRRLSDFEQFTQPVIDFLQANCREVIAVPPGDATPREVADWIWESLNRSIVRNQDGQVLLPDPRTPVSP